MQRTRRWRVERFALAGTFGAMALLVVACGGSAPEPPALSEAESAPAEPLTVGTAPPFPPFQFKGESGALEGFDVDLMRALGEQLGREIELQPLAYGEIFSALEAGKIDAAISAIPIPQQRSETIDFSRPYLAADLVLAVRQSDPSITSEADLRGKTLGVQLNTAGAERAIGILGSRIMTFDTAEAAVQALRQGDVDAVLHSQPVILNAIAAETAPETPLETLQEAAPEPRSESSSEAPPGSSEPIRVLEPPLERHSYGIALPEDAAETEALNRALEALAKDGTYTQIYEKWFGTAPSESP